MRYLLISLLIFLGAQGEKYDISLRLEEGTVYYQTIRTESDFLMVMNEQEMPVNTILEASLSYKVIKVYDDHYDLQIQYEKLWLMNKSPMATMEFSSESEDTTNMMSGFLREMVHKAFSARMNKQGEIFEIQNFDTLYSTIWDGKAAEMIRSKEELNEMINEKMGIGMIMENYDLLSSFYPDRMVAEGESWSNTAKLGKKIGGSTMNTFSLIGLSGGNLAIEGTSESYAKDEDVSMEVMGKTYKYDLEGGMTFEGLVDAETGWIKDATIRQDFKGEIKIVAEDPWNDKSFPIAISNLITITNK